MVHIIVSYAKSKIGNDNLNIVGTVHGRTVFSIPVVSTGLESTYDSLGRVSAILQICSIYCWNEHFNSTVRKP